MANADELMELLTRSSYLDEMISYFHDSHDPLILRLLLDDPDYSSLLIQKFFYPDQDSLLHDVNNFDRLNARIHTVITRLDYWFNCTNHSGIHTTDKVRFLFVCSGRCVCHYDNALVHLESGDTCIVPAGVSFSHEGLGSDCRLVHALISPDFIQRTLMNKLPHTGMIPESFYISMLDPQKKSVQIIKNPNPEPARHFILNAMYENQYKKMYYREPLESYLVLFITEQLRALSATSDTDRFVHSSEDKRMLDIKRYIELNSKTITLASAAAHFHFTPSYLSQLVSRQTGKTFTQLVQEARLLEAARLLLHTTTSITEIITDCGYQNTSYFYRIFTQRFGCTPSEYRQRKYGLEFNTAITDNTIPK